ncbi:MAG: DUF3298 and DUF4163 domain-containing protein [Bacillota bacterium]|nr:DUF3298 and DUF4163 domain-containing protein [Bacillota bacterium]
MQKKYNEKAIITNKDIQKDFTYLSTVMITLDISYPAVKLIQNPSPENRINRHYRLDALDFYRYASTTLFKGAINEYRDSIKNDFPFRPYDAVMKYFISLNGSCHLSSYTDRYEYTGGAHGNTIRSSATFDLKSGRQLELRDLFKRGANYRYDILKNITEQAEKNLSENPGIYFEDYKQLIIENFNPKSFYLTPEALAVYYQQYEIAPYSTGIVVFEIPYSKLEINPPRC